MKYFISKKINLTIILLALLTIISSCKENDPESGKTDETDETKPNQNVNDWILENMEAWYLWNDKLPSKTDKNLDPDDYFESLLYKAEDRFSWIQANFIELIESLSGIQMESGYDFSLFLWDEEDNSVVGLINYVKPNSPASNAGLRRGDLFLTINGTQLTINNYQTLLNSISSAHTLGIYDGNIRTVSLSVTKYEENPILLDTIYEISDKKIGYLIYNFFAQDNGNNSLSYVKELNQVFGNFKENGINELILDLRYNSGGSITTSVALSSMIANRTTSDLFVLEEYNSLVDSYYRRVNGENYNKTFFQNQLVKYDTNGNVVESVPINKLTTLNQIYVLTSDRTASASELVINGLIPYISIVIVGDTTYGKNVGSITIYEDDPVKQKTNTWGMQPIVVKLANANKASDYGKGFAPDVKVSEYDAFPLLPLGDTNETMLQAALIEMGVAFKSSPAKGNRSVGKTKTPQFRPISSSIDRTPVRRNVYLD
jgi:C-terminal processing protease CtpA/Prc